MSTFLMTYIYGLLALLVTAAAVTEQDSAAGVGVTSANALDIKETKTITTAAADQQGRQYLSYGGCPLCDASVYSYCSHKMIHDSCCCSYPSAQLKPPQCLYYDCTLLYAKSCFEHTLITNCCCNNLY